MTDAPEISDDLFLEASEWWRRAQGRLPNEIAALEDWLEADDRHATAFSYVRSVWESFDDNPTTPDMLKFRTEILGRSEKVWRRRLAPNSVSRRVAIAGIAAGVGAAVVTPLYLLLGGRQHENITTGVGEQRVTTLSDGSRVTVDAKSKLDVRFDRELRTINLVSGRAHFEVAKQPSRPFKVHALESTITALGTAFTVEVRKKVVSVTLLEGRIDVSKAVPHTHTIQTLEEVKPAQQVVIMTDSPAPPKYQPVDEAQALAWRDSELIFNDETLGEVVDRMNDYSRQKIFVDASASQIHVSGMYIAGETDAFIDALEKFYPVKAAVTADGITISARG